MISLRQHAISIVAIFLALALGIVLGSTALADSVFSGLSNDKAELQSQLHRVEGEGNALREQANRAEQFGAAIAPLAVRDALGGRSVVLVAAPDASGADLDAIADLAGQAGGRVTGRVVLTESFVNVNEGDRLRGIVMNSIPAGVQLRTGAVDQGSLAGDLLGSVLLLDPVSHQPTSTPEERALVLAALQQGGFVSEVAAPMLPTESADAAIVVTGSGNGEEAANGNVGALVARISGALAGRSMGVVLAGQNGSGEGNSAVAVTRADSALAAAVSTVDTVDTPSGKVTAVLALRERFDGGRGHFGAGPGATAVTVGG